MQTEDKSKRTGFSWISPAINTPEVGKAVDFYKKAFGFKTTEKVEGKGGNLLWAACVYKDISIMIGMPENPDTHSVPENMPLSMYVYHENPDQIAEQARAAGGQVLMEPDDMFWGDRMTVIQDPFGYTWNFAKPVGEVDRAKAPADWQ